MFNIKLVLDEICIGPTKKSLKTHVIKSLKHQNYTQSESELRYQTHCRTRNSESLGSVELRLQNQHCKIIVTSFCLFAHAACTFNHLSAFQRVSFEVFCRRCTLNRIRNLIQNLTGAKPTEIKGVFWACDFRVTYKVGCFQFVIFYGKPCS